MDTQSANSSAAANAPHANIVRPDLWQLWPEPLRISARDKMLAIVGATLGIAVVAWLSHSAALAWSLPWTWLVAPMGASAVLVFAVASSPMAQPWSVIVGHTVAALVGLLCAHVWGSTEWSAAISVGVAIGAMYALRCLHPPAGGTALLMVLSGPLPWSVALFPVACNAALLVLAAMLVHRLSRRTYPSAARHGELARSPSVAEREAAAVLELYHRTLSIGRSELVTLLRQTRLHSHHQQLENLCCADIMVRDVHTVHPSTTVAQAAHLLQQFRIKALPVVDAERRLTGIVTLADVMVHGPASSQTVAAIMSRQVRVASAARPVTELLDLFAHKGHHHLPIVGPDARLVGIITQTDIVAALCRSNTDGTQ